MSHAAQCRYSRPGFVPQVRQVGTTPNETYDELWRQSYRIAFSVAARIAGPQEAPDVVADAFARLLRRRDYFTQRRHNGRLFDRLLFLVVASLAARASARRARVVLLDEAAETERERQRLEYGGRLSSERDADGVFQEPATPLEWLLAWERVEQRERIKLPLRTSVGAIVAATRTK